jgi:hypothetical protein
MAVSAVDRLAARPVQVSTCRYRRVHLPQSLDGAYGRSQALPSLPQRCPLPRSVRAGRGGSRAVVQRPFGSTDQDPIVPAVAGLRPADRCPASGRVSGVARLSPSATRCAEQSGRSHFCHQHSRGVPQCQRLQEPLASLTTAGRVQPAAPGTSNQPGQPLAQLGAGQGHRRASKRPRVFRWLKGRCRPATSPRCQQPTTAAATCWRSTPTAAQLSVGRARSSTIRSAGKTSSPACRSGCPVASS